MTTNAHEAAKNQFQVQGRVKVIQGSILQPHNAGLRIVLNFANLSGKIDGPIYAVWAKKWNQIQKEVKGAYAQKTGAYKLGTIACTTAVQSDVWAVSLLCQDDKLKTDVKALEASLKEVCKMAKSEQASVHISSFLVDIVPELQELAQKTLVENGISVNYYEEPSE